MSQDFQVMLKNLYSHTVPLINVEQAFNLVNNDEVAILDIREEEEYNVSHIYGAEFISYKSFDIKEVHSIDKDKLIIVYCSVGYRSEKVGEQFNKAGFKNVYNLYGGLFHWVNEQLPVVDNEGKITLRVHPYNEEWSRWLERGEKVYE